MTTKRIDRNDEVGAELIRNLALNKRQKKNPANIGEALDQDKAGVGTVDVGLSSAINSTLNPEQMAAERKEKVQRLKDLIAAGKYNPSSEQVAQAFQEDVVMEILTSDGSQAVFDEE